MSVYVVITSGTDSVVCDYSTVSDALRSVGVRVSDLSVKACQDAICRIDGDYRANALVTVHGSTVRIRNASAGIDY